MHDLSPGEGLHEKITITAFYGNSVAVQSSKILYMIEPSKFL